MEMQKILDTRFEGAYFWGEALETFGYYTPVNFINYAVEKLGEAEYSWGTDENDRSYERKVYSLVNTRTNKILQIIVK